MSDFSELFSILSRLYPDKIKMTSEVQKCARKRACLPKLRFWKPGIFQWRANSRTCKEFLLYFIFINLSAQEVWICSEFCFNSKWIFFSYEFSTFFDLFAKNNLQKEWRQRSNAIIFLSFFQFFSNFFKVSG